MSQVVFIYNGSKTIIQCNENEKMKDICQRFLSKIKIDNNSIFFSYDGKAGNQFNDELSFIEMANSLDKAKKSMSILVESINEINQSKIDSVIKSKNIICPECGESSKICIKNYKISFYDCKKNHKNNNFSFDQYDKTQNIDLTKIVCNKCKEKNKYNSFNNEFYKCINCNINICPLCKSIHDKNHNIINYEDINYICINHKEKFSKYCNQCKINICSICEEDHINHNTIYLGDIINKKELENKIEKLKTDIEICNNNINEIIDKMNIVKKNINKYYKIIIEIVNNYDIKKRNYNILFNLKEINNNNDIIEDINKINNVNNITDRFIHIINIYNKITNNYIKDDINNNINNDINLNIKNNTINNVNTMNENKTNKISLTLKIEKEYMNKCIYFLDNTDGKMFKNKKWVEHHHDCLKELNESNVELYINNIKYKFQKFFIPEKEGIYNIVLILNCEIKDCSFMFFNCINLINIDLSSFITKNITNMEFMFHGCANLIDINLSSFDTKNVIDMENMFYMCKKISNIDFSSFDTKKVVNMGHMFEYCQNLINVDLTSFNTENVTNLEYMFSVCGNLNNIDLSSFDIRNDAKFDGMFSSCSNLKQIKLNKKSSEKIKKQIYSKTVDFIMI